jgi:hypothetical protein
MPTFRHGHAGAPDWRDAANACLEQLGSGDASLGFLYITDVLADHASDILAWFSENTGRVQSASGYARRVANIWTSLRLL